MPLVETNIVGSWLLGRVVVVVLARRINLRGSSLRPRAASSDLTTTAGWPSTSLSTSNMRQFEQAPNIGCGTYTVRRRWLNGWRLDLVTLVASSSEVAAPLVSIYQSCLPVYHSHA
jgi:uncharacterized protein YbjT (DUF2867 family)